MWIFSHMLFPPLQLLFAFCSTTVCQDCAILTVDPFHSMPKSRIENIRIGRAAAVQRDWMNGLNTSRAEEFSASLFPLHMIRWKLCNFHLVFPGSILSSWHKRNCVSVVYYDLCGWRTLHSHKSYQIRVCIFCG